MTLSLDVFLWLFFGGLALVASVVIGLFLAEFTSTLYAAPPPAPPLSPDWYWLELRHAQAADLAELERTIELPTAPETEAAIAAMWERWEEIKGRG